MPFVKKAGKTYKPRAKGGKGRARRGGRKIAVARFVQRTIPDKLMVKLPYTDLQGLNGSGSSADNWRAQKGYNINSLYDPETGALNQQNLGFQQYMQLFRNYRVYRVDYDVTIINTSMSAVAGSISFNPPGGQMDITDIQNLQVPYSRRFTLGLGGSSSSSSAQSMKRIKGSINLPRVCGLTSEQYRTASGGEGFAGGLSFNPAEIVQMSINVMNINNSVQATTQLDIRYTCHVELFNRVKVFGSDAPIEEA